MLPADDDEDTGLARERTALAWRRTSLTHLVTGLVLVRVTDAVAVQVVLGALLVTSSALAAASGHRRGRWRLGAVAAITVAVAVLGAVEVARTASA